MFGIKRSKNGHSWRARVSHRSRGSSNCPYCSKIELKDGTFFASQVEAFWYLMFKRLRMEFKHNKIYPKIENGLGRCRYDFYFPNDDVYVEITSYNKECIYWDRYSKKIERKKEYVENVLKSRFCFVRYIMTKDDVDLVQKNMK